MNRPRSQTNIEKKSYRRFSAFITPLVVYSISFAGPAAVMGIATAVLGWSRDLLYSHLYIIGTLGQLLMDLPALIMFVRSDGSWYSHSRGNLSSIGIGLACAAVLAGLKVALAGRLVFMAGVPAFTQSLALQWPWNLISTTLAVLAYGPGEAIFIVYLTAAFDTAIGNQHRLFSWGIVIAALLWGLPHVANVFFFGWGAIANALLMIVVGLIIGLLFKGTRTSLSSMVFWTLVNGTSA
jgi:hypothetical protein